MARLCVNIDHVATVRNARRIEEPDPVAAAIICEMAGAKGITFHLREDRRHITDRDARLLRPVVKGLLNMEMAATEEMIRIASEIKPDQVTLVPERRQEVTTEGGLDVLHNRQEIAFATKRLQDAGIAVSLFIDPSGEQVEASAECGATHIELNTGRYCEAFTRDGNAPATETSALTTAALVAGGMGLVVNAGHGLNYRNLGPVIAFTPGLNELNIGHSIVGRALFAGIERAVREMVELIDRLSRESATDQKLGQIALNQPKG